jgi:hypothetical protein
VAPLDRGAKRLLPRIRVAAALEKIKTLREPCKHLGRRQHPRASGCELDSEGKPIESLAQLADVRARLLLCAFAEEENAVCLGERRQLVLDLAPDMKHLATRYE